MQRILGLMVMQRLGEVQQRQKIISQVSTKTVPESQVEAKAKCWFASDIFSDQINSTI